MKPTVNYATQRQLSIPAGALNSEERTVELTLASEYPVPRYDWELGEFDEILLCGEANVDLSRMSEEAAAPFLRDHSMRDQIGVVLGGTVADRRVSARVKIQRSANGDQYLADLADRIRPNVSVGYRILDVELHEKRGERSRVVVTRWQPIEVSTVASGADPTVGVGRSETPYPESLLRELRGKRDRTMSEPTPTPADPKPPAPPPVDVKVAENKAREAETARCREILAIAERFDMRAEAQKAIGEGASLEAFRTLALDKMEAQQKAKPPVVDLSPKDRQRYNLGAVAQRLLERNPKIGGFEAEVSRAYEDKGVQLRKEGSLYVPLRYFGSGKRDVLKGNTGAELIAEEHWDDLYESHLLSDLVVMRAGARLIPGLVGDVDIPAGNGSFGNATWVATETTDATEISPTFRTVQGSPKTAAGFVDFSRRMRLQSQPALEQILRMGIADSIRELAERDTLNGDASSGAPRGVIQTVGIVDSDFSGSFAYSDFIDMWAALKNAKGTAQRLAYVTTFGVAAKAMTTTRGGTGSDRMIAEMSADGTIRIDGTPLLPTQELPSTFGSPADDHPVVYGDWSKLVIGTWGDGIELYADDAALALQGGRRIIGFYDMDVMVLLNKSFVLADDVVA